ncbi:molybdopterin molybdotransferase MoeA [Salinibacterium sp. G-O1]|uniref:molybdopterin molybdotransferase MoeA n=1 Tax=Salinibacterium sp. G-O1 TaxID=3046208 RepID=UPI0024B9056C|nr:gephyrin-like molybdotransferase Glp [Salinibacterium sp. G-O1]MDJ0335842.1 molybdopterin molybdotransferase MoeA [Salinibacterium sp. G-O1]
MGHRSVAEHAEHIAAMLEPTLAARIETVALDDAFGRVTAAEVLSPVDLPLFRNSQMDGFAVLTTDLATLPATLPIAGEIAARPGDPLPLLPGSAVRIMTGGVVPAGADAVVPVEDTTVDGSTVTITRARSTGEYVRDQGSDLRRGDRLLPLGLRLGSRHLAALAAAGLTSVDVVARVRVAVITTGSELIQPGDIPVLGQVFDSNATALAAAVRATGAVVAFRAHVLDDHEAMLRALTEAAATADVIITSGGISMGDYEVVRETLEPRGAEVGHVAMQPGGPQATATFDGVPVICFPGNPVSTQISFEVFVAPLLREASGVAAAVRRRRTMTVGTASIAGKRQFLRGAAVGGDGVTLVAGPSSHLVAGLAASDLLIVVPEDVIEIAVDDSVETWEL